MRRFARKLGCGWRIRRPSYAETVSTLALLVAVGTGGAYAVERIGSAEIKDNSIRSRDLRDGAAVRGADVVKDSLGRRQIDEASLVATKIVPVATSEGPNCVLYSGDEVPCGKAVVRLRRPGRIAAVATGSLVTAEGSVAGARAQCAVLENGQDFSLNRRVGDPESRTRPGSGNGFSVTYLSPGNRPAGRYVVEFSCFGVGAGTAIIENPTLLVFAFTGS